jgi:hypothetical protein
VARAMNVEKRVDALRAMVAKLEAYGAKATQIAEELTSSFEGDKSSHGKKALQLAKAAMRMASAFQRAAASVKL